MKEIKQQSGEQAPPAHGGRLEDAAARHGIPAHELLDFSASINPLSPDGVKAALRRATLDAGFYPEEDAASLRERMADYLGVFPDEVVPGNGSIECIYWLARVLAPARVLIVEPTFSEYRQACVSAGAVCDSLLLREEDAFVFDAKALRPEGYDAVFICNPNNPTGNLVAAEDIDLIWRRCREAGAALIIDEAFIDFYGEDASALGGGTAAGLFVLRSFTKSHALAGVRLGCLVTESAAAERIHRAMPPWNINAFAHEAGLAALRDAGHMHRSRCALRQAKKTLMEDLRRMPGVDPLPSETNFILCRLDEPGSAELCEMLASQGILVRDCRSFPGMEDRYIRVAVRSDRDNYQLVSALRKALA